MNRRVLKFPSPLKVRYESLIEEGVEILQHFVRHGIEIEQLEAERTAMELRIDTIREECRELRKWAEERGEVL